MHELSVCKGLLEQVAQVASPHHPARVSSIHLQIGPLSGVDPALLESAFPVARAGTVAAEARLVIRTMPVRVLCTACNTESDATPNRLVCMQCGSQHTRLVGGDELLLERIELSGIH